MRVLQENAPVPTKFRKDIGSMLCLALSAVVVLMPCPGKTYVVNPGSALTMIKHGSHKFLPPESRHPTSLKMRAFQPSDQRETSLHYRTEVHPEEVQHSWNRQSLDSSTVVQDKPIHQDERGGQEEATLPFFATLVVSDDQEESRQESGTIVDSRKNSIEKMEELVAITDVRASDEAKDRFQAELVEHSYKPTNESHEPRLELILVAPPVTEIADEGSKGIQPPTAMASSIDVSSNDVQVTDGTDVSSKNVQPSSVVNDTNDMVSKEAQPSSTVIESLDMVSKDIQPDSVMIESLDKVSKDIQPASVVTESLHKVSEDIPPASAAADGNVMVSKDIQPGTKLTDSNSKVPDDTEPVSVVNEGTEKGYTDIQDTKTKDVISSEANASKFIRFAWGANKKKVNRRRLSTKIENGIVVILDPLKYETMTSSEPITPSIPTATSDDADNTKSDAIQTSKVKDESKEAKLMKIDVVVKQDRSKANAAKAGTDLVQPIDWRTNRQVTGRSFAVSGKSEVDAKSSSANYQTNRSKQATRLRATKTAAFANEIGVSQRAEQGTSEKKSKGTAFLLKEKPVDVVIDRNGDVPSVTEHGIPKSKARHNFPQWLNRFDILSFSRAPGEKIVELEEAETSSSTTREDPPKLLKTNVTDANIISAEEIEHSSITSKLDEKTEKKAAPNFSWGLIGALLKRDKTRNKLNEDGSAGAILQKESKPHAPSVDAASTSPQVQTIAMLKLVDQKKEQHQDFFGGMNGMKSPSIKKRAIRNEAEGEGKKGDFSRVDSSLEQSNRKSNQRDRTAITSADVTKQGQNSLLPPKKPKTVRVTVERYFPNVAPKKAKLAWIDYLWKKGAGLPRFLLKGNGKDRKMEQGSSPAMLTSTKPRGLVNERSLFSALMGDVKLSAEEDYDDDEGDASKNNNTYVDYQIPGEGFFSKFGSVAESHFGRVDFIHSETTTLTNNKGSTGTSMIWTTQFDVVQNFEAWKVASRVLMLMASDNLKSYLTNSSRLSLSHTAELPGLTPDDAVDLWMQYIWKESGGLPFEPPIAAADDFENASEGNLLKRLMVPNFIASVEQTLKKRFDIMTTKKGFDSKIKARKNNAAISKFLPTYVDEDKQGEIHRLGLKSSVKVSTMMIWDVELQGYDKHDGNPKEFSSTVAGSLARNFQTHVEQMASGQSQQEEHHEDVNKKRNILSDLNEFVSDTIVGAQAHLFPITPHGRSGKHAESEPSLPDHFEHDVATDNIKLLGIKKDPNNSSPGIVVAPKDRSTKSDATPVLLVNNHDVNRDEIVSSGPAANQAGREALERIVMLRESFMSFTNGKLVVAKKEMHSHEKETTFAADPAEEYSSTIKLSRSPWSNPLEDVTKNLLP